MKNYLFLLVIIFNLTILGAGNYFERTLNKTFDSSNIETIKIKNINGDITIKTTNSNTIKLNMEFKGKWANEITEKELLNSVIEITHTNNTLNLKVKKLENKTSLWDFFFKKYPEVKINLQIPDKQFNFNIETVNGDIRCLQFNAKEFNVSTVNGTILIANCLLSKKANIETVNGSIKADFNQILNNLDISTVNGGITVTLPENFNAQLSASTINGSIKNNFGWSIKKHFGPKSLEVIQGNKTFKINLSTVNGSIKILK